MAEDLKEMKGMSEDEARAKLRLIAIKKEKQRAANVETGQAQRESISEHHSSTIPDIAKSAAQTATFEFGDEMIGSVSAAYQKITGDDRPMNEIYNEARDAVRQNVANARSDTPFGTFLTDIVLPNPAKFIKYAKAMGPITTGMAYGAGATPSNPITETEDFATDVGIGGTIGAGMKAIGYAGGKIFGKPQQSEIKYLGMENTGHKGAEGDVLGIIDNLEDSVDHLRKSGAFQKGARNWDLNKRKFVMRGSGKGKASPKGLLTAPNTEQTIRKFKFASKKISKNIEKKILKESPEIYEGEYSDDLHKLGDAESYLAGGKRRGYGSLQKSGVYDIEDLKRFNDNKLIEIQNDLAGTFRGREDEINTTVNGVVNDLYNGKKAFTVMDAQKVKQGIYKKLEASYNKAAKGGVPTYNDVEEATLKRTANFLKDFVNDKVPSVKMDNQDLEAMFAFKHSTSKKQALQYFGGDQTMREVGQGGMFNKGVRLAGELYDPLRPYTAKIGRTYDKAKGIPYARPYMEGAGSSLGGKMMGRLSDMEAQEMKARNEPDRFGRSPDSVGRSIDEAAEEVMNTPLPRDAQEILDNPKHMLMKVAQQMPDQYDQINHILTKRPDLFRKTLPMLVNMMPELFELDDYNRVDGKIMDPNLRTKAEQDLWKRDDIPVEAKVEINDMLNKDGSYPL